MYGLFAQENKTGRVYKNNFWESAERLGANLTKDDVDACFKLFDRTGKGYFGFMDFTRVSKLVQGYEIDQLFHHGDKLNTRPKGKRCRGFSEREDLEYDAQKAFRSHTQLTNKPNRNTGSASFTRLTIAKAQDGLLH